jgi:hypothetical protein
MRDVNRNTHAEVNIDNGAAISFYKRASISRRYRCSRSRDIPVVSNTLTGRREIRRDKIQIGSNRREIDNNREKRWYRPSFILAIGHPLFSRFPSPVVRFQRTRYILNSFLSSLVASNRVSRSQLYIWCLLGVHSIGCSAVCDSLV